MTTSHALSYVIKRVDPPRWQTAVAETDHDPLYELTGEQTEWGWAIPLLYQVLASPSSHRPFPHRPSDDSHDVALAYWSALLHLLIYSFGWARPDRGLRWWFDAGRPVDDPRLLLIRELWDSDGQLDWFASWLWTTRQLADVDALEAIAGRTFDRESLPVDQAWLDQVLGTSATGIASPAPIGGTDPLHLSSHCSGPLADPGSTPTLLRSGSDDRRAVLVTDSMIGWYRALGAVDLPNLGDRSWHVDVVAKPVGFLGTFRRSRDTGLWFSGKHSIHLRGV